MKIRTIRKTPRIAAPGNKVIKGAPLAYNAAAADRYYSRLAILIRRMSTEVKRELDDFFKQPHAKEYFAQDASVSSQARILLNALAEKFDDLFGFKSAGISEKVNDDAFSSSATSLKQSLKTISEGLTLKTDFITPELREISKAIISENVSLIKSIPSEYFTDIQGAVYRSITTGNGLADLLPFIRKHEGITLRRAKLIAYDQTRKAFSNINRVRMEKLGVKKFEWLHSHAGQVPRKLHLELNGEIFRMDNPPIIDDRTGERGFPGQLINCKCRMVPIVDFDTDFE